MYLFQVQGSLLGTVISLSLITSKEVKEVKLNKEKMDQDVLQQRPQPVPQGSDIILTKAGTILRAASRKGLATKYLLSVVVLGSRLSCEALAANILVAGEGPEVSSFSIILQHPFH